MYIIPALCVIKDCDRLANTKSMCKTHYMRLWLRDNNYDAWHHAKSRVNNPNDSSYEHYGGRGIVMCHGWQESYVDFNAAIGIKPSKDYSLDRIDTNGHYSCGKCQQCISNNWSMNCRWTNRSSQNYNRRMMPFNTSGYRGVSYHNKKQRFIAQIKLNKKLYYLGAFIDSEQAALAYDCAAIQLFGLDAQLNLV